MASIYEFGRDKVVKGSCWYFDYSDEDGERVKGQKGFTDKGETTMERRQSLQTHLRRKQRRSEKD